MGLPLISDNWPIRVEIFEKRQTGNFVKHDRAKRVWKEGKYTFQLKKENVRTKPVAPEYMFVDGKGKHHLKLYSPAPRIYSPIKINTEQADDKTGKGAEFITINEDTRNHIIRDAQEQFARFKEKRSFLAEYGALIAMITFAAVFLIVLSILSGYIESISGSLGHLADTLINMGDYVNLGPPD